MVGSNGSGLQARQANSRLGIHGVKAERRLAENEPLLRRNTGLRNARGAMDVMASPVRLLEIRSTCLDYTGPEPDRTDRASDHDSEQVLSRLAADRYFRTK